MSLSVKLEGFKELDNALAELSRAAGKGVLRRSLKKAAEPMADLASSLAPRGPTGNLATSVKYGTKLTKRQAGLHRKMFRDDKASVEGFVGANDPAAVPQEFGTVDHGPQPFMRPAWDQDALPLLDRLGKELAVEVEKSVKRARAKAARG
jgi:HK97 gp10 family phage protein